MKYLIYDNTSTESLKQMDGEKLMTLLIQTAKEPSVKYVPNLTSAYPEFEGGTADLSYYTDYTTSTFSKNILYQSNSLIFKCTKGVYSESVFGDYTIDINGKTFQSGEKQQIAYGKFKYQDTLTVTINYSGTVLTFFTPFLSLLESTTVILPEELSNLLASNSNLSNITVDNDGKFSGITNDNVAILTENGYYAEAGRTFIYPIFQTRTLTFNLSRKFNGHSMFWFTLHI